jgi:purine-binding chemotaxis protein CheW
MAELYLVVRMAGERVALRASEVESVVEIETLTPVPGAPAHVAGLAALRSRVLTVVDAARAIGDIQDRSDPVREALVAVIDGHPYALLVDSVEDVEEGASEGEAPGIPGSRWTAVGRATVDIAGDLLLVIDVSRLIAGAGVGETQRSEFKQALTNCG